MSLIVDPARVKLGKRAPRDDHRTLRLSKYATTGLVPPKRMDWSLGINDFPMLLNDQIGDCAVAGPAHMIQAWTSNNGNMYVPSDVEVQRDYSAISGYDPADPSTDNGCVMLDVMNYWRRHGICGHKIDGYVAINPRNRDHMALSIDLFGGLALGFSLPLTTEDQEVWSVVDDQGERGAPGSRGGHMVPALNYGPAGIVVVTWGGLLMVAWEFVDRFCDEAFCVLSPDWASQVQASPGNINYAQLQEDLRAISG